MRLILDVQFHFVNIMVNNILNIIGIRWINFSFGISKIFKTFWLIYFSYNDAKI